MKINVTRDKEITFADVGVGEVFGFNYDVYMKVAPFRGEIEYNAVHLYTGTLDTFDDDINVDKVEAILNVEM